MTEKQSQSNVRDLLLDFPDSRVAETLIELLANVIVMDSPPSPILCKRHSDQHLDLDARRHSNTHWGTSELALVSNLCSRRRRYTPIRWQAVDASSRQCTWRSMDRVGSPGEHDSVGVLLQGLSIRLKCFWVPLYNSEVSLILL